MGQGIVDWNGYVKVNQVRVRAEGRGGKDGFLILEIWCLVVVRWLSGQHGENQVVTAIVSAEKGKKRKENGESE